MKTPILAAALLALSAGGALALPSIDANGDGKISAAEFKAGRTALIMGADADKDGKVSPAELGVVVEQVSAGRPAAEGQRVFARIDANHDGFLTRPEVEAVVERRFRTLDANGDGALSAAERQNWKVPG